MILDSPGDGGKMRRAFIAMEVPRSAVPADILEEVRKVRVLRPVRTHSFHLTLHFLGDIETGALNSIAGKLSGVKFPDFTASVSGIGAFPEPSRAKVLFVKVKENSHLEKLHRQILESLSIAEDREFIPHVTIARATKWVDLRELCKRYESFSEIFKVNSYFLFLSTLTNQGPIYEKFSEFPSVKEM